MKVTIEIEGVETANLNDMLGRVLDHLSEQERERTKQYELRAAREREEQAREAALQRDQVHEQDKRIDAVLTSVLGIAERVVTMWAAPGQKPAACAFCEVHDADPFNTKSEAPSPQWPVWVTAEAQSRIGHAAQVLDWKVLVEEFVQAFIVAKETLAIATSDDVKQFILDFVRVYELSSLIEHYISAASYITTHKGVKTLLLEHKLPVEYLWVFERALKDAGWSAYWETTAPTGAPTASSTTSLT